MEATFPYSLPPTNKNKYGRVKLNTSKFCTGQIWQGKMFIGGMGSGVEEQHEQQQQL